MPFPDTTIIDKRPNIFFATLAQDLNEEGGETEIFLSSITTLDGTVLTTADISFFGRCILTIAPQSSTEIEFASFTGFSTPDISVTGAIRGLSFNSNTSISVNQHFHATGTPVIISFGTHDFIDIQDALVTLLDLINSAIVSGAVLASDIAIGITELTAAVGATVGVCTISIANPAVITKASHGLHIGNVVQFTTTGTLPSPIVAGTNYYILTAGFTVNSFEISATPEGTAINTLAGSQSGVQTLVNQTPRAVGENDTRLSPVSLATLTAGMVAALAGDNGTPSASDTYVTQSGFQNGAEVYAVTTGAANTFEASLTPTPASLIAGMTLRLKANFGITGASLLAITGVNGATLGTVTMTIASPAVFTLTSHGLVAGDIVKFTTTGALPTGLTVGTKYYVISSGLTANAFEVSATLGGAAINTTGTQSGTHTLVRQTANITKLGTTAVASGDITSGMQFIVTFDGTEWQLQTPIAVAAGTTYKNGTATKDVTDASAVQTIAHGLGKIPLNVHIKAMGSAAAQTSGGQGVQYAIGSDAWYNGTTQVAVNSTVSYNGTYYTSAGGTGFVLGANGNSGNPVITQTGVITFDATNIYITWTKAGSAGTGTHNLIWEGNA